MPGFKNTIIADEPIAFWTFDGDSFDPTARTITQSPPIIIDEMNNKNPGILQGASDSPSGYRMGMPSLCPLELGGQNSMAFGYYEKQSGLWQKAYVEVPHSSDFNFDNNNGSMTLEFLMKKENEDTYRYDVNDYSFDRPIIKKDGVFNIYSNWNYSSSYGHVLKFVFPSGTYDIGTSSSNDYSSYSWIGRTIHVIMIWDVTNSAPGVYSVARKVYINGRKIIHTTTAYQDAPKEMTYNTPIQIGGWAGSHSENFDRNTSALYMDQIAIYDKGLTDTQIARHYRKVRNYDDMIKEDYGIENYWPLDDQENPNDFTAYRNVGSYNGVYSGVIGTIVRDQPGPDIIFGSRSVYFKDETQLYIRETGGSCQGYEPIFQTNGSYTVEFWFKSSTRTIGCLFNTQQLTKPFRGVMVWVNKEDKEERPGYIQFHETQNDYITCAGDFTDNIWHHLAVGRTGNDLFVYIDGNLVGYKANVASGSMGTPSGQISMMNSHPGLFGVTGHICKVAQYGLALQSHQILMRAHNSVIYKIEGQVTLRGVPTMANIRIYYHTSGKLIDEIESDADTGNYVYYLPTNEAVDLLIFDDNDPSVRFRSFGPIIPAECEDTN